MKKCNQVGTLLLAGGLSLFLAVPSLAGEWRFDGPENWKYWYDEGNGAYPTNDWRQIDGEWYHFDQDGYLDIGWHNYPETKMIQEEEGSFEVSTPKWYFFDDSGKMLKNQNYIGGYTDESGLLIPDTLSYTPKDNSLVYERATGGEETPNIPKPIAADAQFIDGSPQTSCNGGHCVTSGGGFNGWRYSMPEERKVFFIEVYKNISQLVPSFTAPLSKETNDKDRVFHICGINNLFYNETLCAEHWEYKIDDNNIAHFTVTGYEYGIDTYTSYY